MKNLTLTFATLVAACVTAIAGPERILTADCAQFGGFNIGANAGWATQTWTWVDRDDWIDNFSFDFNTSSPSKDRDGFTAGASFGYDWQKGCALFGMLVDGNWTSLGGTELYSPGNAPATVLTLKDDLNWWGTARVRTGVVVDTLLLYVTGGIAFGDVDHRWTIDDPAIPAHESFAGESLRWGGVAGVGTEWAVNSRWSLRSEFLYVHFTEENTTSSSLAAGGDVHFDSQDSMFVTRVALVYRFGGGN